MKCLILSTIYKNEGYLHKAFDNIKKIQSLFDNTKIVLCYDNSGDKSLKELCELKKDFDIEILFNDKDRFIDGGGRAYNIAQARNQLINHIYCKYDDYDYFIMCDLDDVFCYNIHIDILNKYLNRSDEWDSLTFYNEGYYDTWALSIDDYNDSSWHTEKDGWVENRNRLKYLKNAIDDSDNDLIDIYSGFNGFCIHKMNKFRNIRYQPATIQNNCIIFDCEHRSYYNEAVAYFLKVKMSKDCLFDKMNVCPELYE